MGWRNQGPMNPRGRAALAEAQAACRQRHAKKRLEKNRQRGLDQWKVKESEQWAKASQEAIDREVLKHRSQELFPVFQSLGLTDRKQVEVLVKVQDLFIPYLITTLASKGLVTNPEGAIAALMPSRLSARKVKTLEQIQAKRDRNNAKARDRYNKRKGAPKDPRHENVRKNMIEYLCKRWHQSRKIVSPDCEVCQRQQITPQFS